MQCFLEPLTIRNVLEQTGWWGDQASKALTDMLRSKKHIRVVKLDGNDEQAHDKCAALALPNMAINDLSVGRGACSHSVIARTLLLMRPLSACPRHRWPDAAVARQSFAASNLIGCVRSVHFCFSSLGCRCLRTNLFFHRLRKRLGAKHSVGVVGQSHVADVV